MRLWIAGWAGGEKRAVKKGMSLISKDFEGKTRGAISSRVSIRGIGVGVAKVEVGRDVAGGLGSKSEKWKLVAGGTQTLGWFKKV